MLPADIAGWQGAGRREIRLPRPGFFDTMAKTTEIQ
jgi:hypothetical protein